jgi:predicted phage terminase large subunit-like protein
MNKDERAAQLLGSFLLFTQVFYELRTGREFVISQPVSRESHYITIAKQLTKVINGESPKLIINVPPRYGKTEMLIHFIAWSLARYPDSNFMYVSYSHSLAKKQTQTIREIITLPEYRQLFNVHIKDDVSAKDNFETTAGGSVYAVGAGGTILGRGAGIQNCDRFGGAIVIDDIHKADEVTSDVMRGSINDWYKNTLQSRVNSPITPIIFIGQGLHEDDLSSNLAKGYDGNIWFRVALPALDALNNALHPTMHTREKLLQMQESMPYEFAAQYQQNPQPAGGGIFKPEWFVLLDEYPNIISTFITCDTAETDKDYNDATVFSFWGLYKITQANVETDLLGIISIDCWEERIEPKDLEPTFMHFYAECMRFKVKPKIAAIEKKSTGTTLISILKKMQGLEILEIERNRGSGNKTSRFLAAQPYVAQRRVSLLVDAKHTSNFIEHMRKITANETHRFDDIADTMADAIRLGLIDKVIVRQNENDVKQDQVTMNIANHYRHLRAVRDNAWRR